jgi:hypothetical protein
MSVLTLRDPSGAIECGSRFKYLPNEITLSYDNLVNAITDAIEKEAAEHGGKFVTEERMTVAVQKDYNHAELMEEFQGLVGELMSKDSNNANKITLIVEKYLGRGKKISETNANQAELVYLIINDIKEELM